MRDYPDKMTPEQARTFGEDVLNIVSQIPRGKVMTYGHIAAWAGWPSHSRMVGRTLRYSCVPSVVTYYVRTRNIRKPRNSLPPAPPTR